jgi:hypothetical protein
MNDALVLQVFDQRVGHHRIIVAVVERTRAGKEIDVAFAIFIEQFRGLTGESLFFIYRSAGILPYAAGLNILNAGGV